MRDPAAAMLLLVPLGTSINPHAAGQEEVWVQHTDEVKVRRLDVTESLLPLGGLDLHHDRIGISKAGQMHDQRLLRVGFLVLRAGCLVARDFLFNHSHDPEADVV